MTSNNDLSFLEDAQPSPVTALGALMEYVNNLDQINNEIEDLEKQLDERKSVKRNLEESVIPALLDQHGVSEIKLSNGRNVTVGEDLFCRLPEDIEKRMAALSWLRENGAGDKIRSEAKIEGANQELFDQLSALGIGFAKVETVHPASLKSWFKEVVGLKKGSMAIMALEEIPAEFGVFIKRTTKIK